MYFSVDASIHALAVSSFDALSIRRIIHQQRLIELTISFSMKRCKIKARQAQSAQQTKTNKAVILKKTLNILTSRTLFLASSWALFLAAALNTSAALAQDSLDNGQLPPIGATVSLAQIEQICLTYQLPELWQKISQDPPQKKFVSDGCTKWFDEWRDKSLYPACLLHDLKYWSGYPGESLERLQADADLMLDVARILQDTVMAEAMFHGVRIGGTEKLGASFSWGFGRQE